MILEGFFRILCKLNDPTNHSWILVHFERFFGNFKGCIRSTSRYKDCSDLLSNYDPSDLLKTLKTILGFFQPGVMWEWWRRREEECEGKVGEKGDSFFFSPCVLFQGICWMKRLIGRGGTLRGGCLVSTSSKVKPTAISNDTSIRNLTTPHQTNKHTRPIKEWEKLPNQKSVFKPQNTSQIPRHFFSLSLYLFLSQKKRKVMKDTGKKQETNNNSRKKTHLIKSWDIEETNSIMAVTNNANSIEFH